MFTNNFSDRFKKAMSGFQKAHDELTGLKTDINAETKRTEEHLAKLQSATRQVDLSLEQLAPFVQSVK